MTINEIIKKGSAQTDKYRIRRKHYHPSLYLITSGPAHLFIRTREGNFWEPTIGDLTADDWEFYNEEKKGISVLELFAKYEQGQKVREISWDKGVYVTMSGAGLKRADGSFFGMGNGEDLNGRWEPYEEPRVPGAFSNGVSESYEGPVEKCEACEILANFDEFSLQGAMYDRNTRDGIFHFLLKKACTCNNTKEKEQKTECAICQSRKRVKDALYGVSEEDKASLHLSRIITTMLEHIDFCHPCTCDKEGA